MDGSQVVHKTRKDEIPETKIIQKAFDEHAPNRKRDNSFTNLLKGWRQEQFRSQQVPLKELADTVKSDFENKHNFEDRAKQDAHALTSISKLEAAIDKYEWQRSM